MWPPTIQSPTPFTTLIFLRVWLRRPVFSVTFTALGSHVALNFDPSLTGTHLKFSLMNPPALVARDAIYGRAPTHHKSPCIKRAPPRVPNELEPLVTQVVRNVRLRAREAVVDGNHIVTYIIWHCVEPKGGGGCANELPSIF